MIPKLKSVHPYLPDSRYFVDPALGVVVLHLPQRDAVLTHFDNVGDGGCAVAEHLFSMAIPANAPAGRPVGRFNIPMVSASWFLAITNSPFPLG